MRIFLGCLGFALVSVCLLAFATKGKKATNYLGQRCPPDMEFIPGNGTVSSFFMGKSEETNLDYAIYMDWLQRVYIDLPQVANDARPHEVEYGDLFKYNDPILQGQLMNPAFAYYPVTGCDWLQAQDYMAWKTDRLNEAILVRTGHFKWNPQQTGSDNFNTEAFLVGQYEGARGRKELPQGDEEVSIYGKNMAKSLPILFTGYRLPTEEEWEYAAGADFSNKQTSGGDRYPYGNKYFLFDYVVNLNYPGLSPLVNYIANAGMGESPDLNRIKGGSTYKTNLYGISNMGDNVEEWMMDTYTPAVKHYANTESIYTMSGFKIAEEVDYKNKDRQYIQKDSTGRMPYRVMGFRVSGDELKVMRHKRWGNAHLIAEKVRNPDSLKIKSAQLQVIGEKMNEIKQYATYYPAYRNNYGNPNPWPLYQMYGNGPQVQIQNLEYYRKEHIIGKNGKQKDTLILDENLIINSKKYVEERDYMTIYRYVAPSTNDTASVYRVVKTGTWKNPSTTARRKMKETEASANVGFRAVIQYYGMPINKGDIVKWNRKRVNRLYRF